METSAAVAAAERQAASLRELTSRFAVAEVEVVPMRTARTRRTSCLLSASDSAKPAPIMATAIQNRTASQPSPERSLRLRLRA
eukprot:3253500-Pleurochrysis_carterae.AAC.3